MSLKKLLSRVKNAGQDLGGAVQDAGGGLRDLAQPALDLINDNAPAGLTDTLATGARYAGHTALLANPLTQLPYATYRAFQAGRSLFEGEPLRALGVAAGPTADAAKIGHGLVEEPALYGVNRALGTDTVDVKDDQGNVIGTRPAGGPFSGRNRAAIGQAAGEIDNPVGRVAARAGLAGLDITTNPATYAPTGELPLIAQLGAGALGIGGFGGNGALSKAARALIMGGAGEAGSEALDSTGIPGAPLVGGLLGMAAAHQIGSRVPGLNRAFAESPVPAGRIRNPFTDPFKPQAELRGTNELGIMDDRIRAMVSADKPVPDQLVSARNDTYRRMYHGTGAVFDAPDPGLFDSSGLFGPGYYLTDSPEVASSYAEKAGGRFRNREAAPNVRPVSVPDSLRLFDIEQPASPQQIDQYFASFPADRAFGSQRLPSGGSRPLTFGTDGDYVRQEVMGELARRKMTEPTFAQVYKATESVLGPGFGFPGDAIRGMGYDGIRYNGGARIPLRDSAGNPIVHDAVMIFPESLPKLRNTLSGTAMGVVGEGTGQAAGRAEPGSFAAETGAVDRVRSIANLTAAGRAAGASDDAIMAEARRMFPGASDAEINVGMTSPPSVRETSRGTVNGRAFHVDEQGKRVWTDTGEPIDINNLPPMPKAGGAPPSGGGLPPSGGATSAPLPGEPPNGANIIKKLANRPPLPPAEGPQLTDYTRLVSDAQGRIGQALGRIQNLDPLMKRQGNELILQTRGAVQQGQAEAAIVRQAGSAYGDVLARGLADGSVAPTAERLVEQRAQMTAIPSDRPAARAMLQQYFDSPANVAQHPDGFQATTPEAQLALAAIDNVHVGQRALEQGTGLDVGEIEGGYLSQAGLWERPQVNSAVRNSPLGRTQGFQKGRVLEDIGAGIVAGYTPKTLDIGDMMAGRIEAGVTAAAHQQLVNALAESPQTMLTRPFVEWDRDTARQNGYVPADLNNSVLAKLKEQAPAGAGDMPYLRPDVAKALDAWQGQANLGVADSLRKAAKITRFGLFALNVAHAPRVGSIGSREIIGAQIGGPLNPVGYVKAAGAFYDALHTAFSDDARAAWAREDAPRWAADIRLPRPGGDNPVLGLEGRSGETGMMALLDRGPFKGVHDWIFQKFLPVYQTNVADELEHQYTRSGYGDLTPEQIHTRIGRAVDATLQGADPVRLGLSKQTQAIAGLANLAPFWRLGRFQQVAQAGMRGVEGDMARHYWATTAALGIAGSAGLTVALSGETDPRKMWDLIDPRNPNSVTNPDSPDFMAVVLPWGQRARLLGVDTAMIKTMLTPVGRAIGEGAANADQFAAINQAQKGMVLGSIYTALTSLGQGASRGGSSTGRYLQYGESGLSIPVKLVEEAMRNRDSLDHPIATAPDFGGKARQMGIYGLKQVLPLSGQPFAEERPVPQGVEGPSVQEKLKAGIAGFAAEQAGVTLNQPSYDPAPYKQKVEAFLSSQGINGGADPVGEFQHNQDISRREKDHFLATNDDVRQYLFAKRADNPSIIKPAGRDAAQAFSNDLGKIEFVRDQAIRAAVGLPGPQYRQAVSTAWNDYLGGKKALGSSYFQTTDLDTIQSKLDDAYGGRDLSTSPLDRAMNEYEAIQVAPGQENDPGARDAMLASRHQYVASHPDVADALRERYRRVGGDTYAQYFDAQQTMGEYGAISAYRTMDAPAARRAQTLVQQAQDAVKYGYVPKAEIALFANTSASPEDRLNALRILKSGSKLANPERRWFLRDPQVARQVSRFYGSVIPELYQQVAQGA